MKGALEKWPSEHELLAQRAQVESVVKKLSPLIEKAMYSLAQNDPKYFKGKNNKYGWHRRKIVLIQAQGIHIAVFCLYAVTYETTKMPELMKRKSLLRVWYPS